MLAPPGGSSSFSLSWDTADNPHKKENRSYERQSAPTALDSVTPYYPSHHQPQYQQMQAPQQYKMPAPAAASGRHGKASARSSESFSLAWETSENPNARGKNEPRRQPLQEDDRFNERHYQGAPYAQPAPSLAPPQQYNGAYTSAPYDTSSGGYGGGPTSAPRSQQFNHATPQGHPAYQPQPTMVRSTQIRNAHIVAFVMIIIILLLFICFVIILSGSCFIGYLWYSSL